MCYKNDKRMQKYQQPKQPDLILNLRNINIFGVHPALAISTHTTLKGIHWMKTMTL